MPNTLERISWSLLSPSITRLSSRRVHRTHNAGTRRYLQSPPYRYLQELYSRLFDHLVRQINASTSAESSSVHRTIALLDIFGFEMFKVNSFEVRSNADAKIIYVILRTPLINFVGTPCLCQQFCINFANEKLQQKFTHDVFKIVQAEYEEVRSITRGSSTVASSSVTENLLYHFS